MRILTLLIFAFAALASSCNAAPPDPFFRMNGPSGCTGTWFSTERGLWGTTARHCARAGRPVRLMLFKDGVRSTTIRGFCYAVHPGWDVSVVYVPPKNYPYAVLPQVLPLSPTGPRLHSTVIVVGSFAGGTVHPAARKVMVIAHRSGRMEWRLNDGAWGGHSGGGVVNSKGEIVGVLWAKGRGYSVITSSRAVLEILDRYRQPKRTNVAVSGQTLDPRPGKLTAAALFSVSDPIEASENTADLPQPTVHVYASQSTLDRIGFSAALRDDSNMQSIIWVYHRPARNKWRFIFEDPKGKGWHIQTWTGIKDFMSRMRQTGIPVQYCPGCPPGRDTTRFMNPWSVQPPTVRPLAPKAPDVAIINSGELDALRKTIRDLEDAARKTKTEAEGVLRKLRHEYEDRWRELTKPPVGPVVVAPGAKPTGKESVNPLKTGLADYKAQRQNVDALESELREASKEIDEETGQKGKKGENDWYWLAALLGTGAVGVGAYKMKKGG